MATAAYGRVRARNLFTPAEQKILDAGGNVSGYAAVDGHFAYVGPGRSGQEAFYAVHPDQRPRAAAEPAASPAPVGPDDSVGMEGIALNPAPPPPAVVEPPPVPVVAKPVDPADDTAAMNTRLRDDAFAQVAALLEDYGLPGLTDLVRQWTQQDLSPAEIALKIRETPEFKNEYGGVLDARKKAGLPAVSVTEIQSYRRRASELFRAAGLPPGFHDDKSDYDAYIAGDVSLSELSDRINLAAQAAFSAPQDVRDTLAEWGMGPGDLTAFWLNPDKAQPLLERKYAAAQLAGASTRTGFGRISEQQATGLTQLGVTADQAQQGFGTLAGARDLFSPLDAGEDVITQQDQIDAVFGGNAAQNRRIELRKRKRQATFEGGGGFASGQGGVSGLADLR